MMMVMIVVLMMMLLNPSLIVNQVSVLERDLDAAQRERRVLQQQAVLAEGLKTQAEQKEKAAKEKAALAAEEVRIG